MNKKCENCNDHFKSNGELICSKCRVKSFEFKTSKRNFYKDKRAWNKLADDALSKITAQYAIKGTFKAPERFVDSKLNIHQ